MYFKNFAFCDLSLISYNFTRIAFCELVNSRLSLKMFLLWHVLIFYTFLGNILADHECGIENAYCHKHNTYTRSVDGSCNNIEHPNWGTQFSIYDRLVPAKYGKDDSLANAKNGKPLPNARTISTVIYTEETYPDLKFAKSAIDYGQLVAHDLGQNALATDPFVCCTHTFTELEHTPEDCASIKIPRHDPYFSTVNATCMSVLRTQTNQQMGCSLNLPHSAQLSKVTAFLDLSVIYGNTIEVSHSLRSHKNGALLLNLKNNHQWLPDAEDIDLYCPFLPENERCYLAGDERLNQNPALTIFQTLWAREHNRIAKALSHINPHWTDEKLFQTARSIAIAEHQYVTYYELLPYWTGKDRLLKLKIIFNSNDFINDYDENVRPHAFNEFSHGAFRYFHSLIPGVMQLVDPKGCPYRSIVLRDHVSRPNLLEHTDYFDSLIRGMTSQPSLSVDAFTDPEITNFFSLISLKFGLDIKAIDIQRSRDHGLGSYNDLRELCGLGKVKYFHQLLDVMDATSVKKLNYLYDHVDDIDLVVGGSLEIPLADALFGPTFLCIVYEQFYRTRRADRFFFENPNSGLTHFQLQEIKKFSLSRLICDNSNNVTHMQRDAFLQVSSSNPRVPCEQIPNLNLNLWKELR